MSDLKNTSPAPFEIPRRNGRGRLSIAVLKRNYPSLYAECVAQGVERERERLLAALLPPSRHAGERFAHECIRNGSPITETVKAHYLILAIEAARKIYVSAQR